MRRTILLFTLAAVAVVAQIANHPAYIRLTGGLSSTSALSTRNLEELYLMDSGSGSTIYDRSGHGRNCTLTGNELGPANNTPAFAWRQVMGLSGAGATEPWFADCPASVLSGKSEMTLVTVARANFPTTWARNWEYGNTGTSNFAYFALSPGAFAGIAATKPVFATSTGGTGAWQFAQDSTAYSGKFDVWVVSWVGASTIKVYRNGALVGSTTTTLSPSDIVGAHQWIGKSAFGDPPLQGDITMMALYSRAWTAAEVSAGSTMLANKQTYLNDWDLPLMWQYNGSAPIIPSVAASWEISVLEPAPLRVGSTFWLGYSGWAGLTSDTAPTNKGCIGMASATITGTTPPTSMTKYAGNPVLCGKGAGLGWPEASVSDPSWYTAPDGTYTMFFFGSDTGGFEIGPNKLGCAYASAPQGPWTWCSPTMVLDLPLGATQLWRLTVVRNGATLYGFANITGGTCTGTECVYLATTSDLTGRSGWSWVGRVLDNGVSIDNQRVADPHVIPIHNAADSTLTWAMMYSVDCTSGCGGRTRLAYAYSASLTSWSKFARNPIFGYGLWRGRMFQWAPGAEWWMVADGGAQAWISH